MFKGSITALITPFKDGQIDWMAFENLIEWQIECGTHGLVPCGTTGESPTVSHEEHNAIVERCVEIVKGRIPVIAGAGSNSTAEAISLAHHAKSVGADATLICSPYYNKPTQEGQYAHFKAIHDAVDLPMILYNIPGRCVVDISVETTRRLADFQNIVGVKDATGDLERPLQTRIATGKDFCQLSGDDATVAGFLAQGGVGCISVVANVAPKLCSDLHIAWQKNDRTEFERIRDLLLPLSVDLFYESSPSPVKYAASALGLCRDEVRLPILPATQDARDRVDSALSHAGIKD